jgi:hypothetical protein
MIGKGYFDFIARIQTVDPAILTHGIGHNLSKVVHGVRNVCADIEDFIAG